MSHRKCGCSESKTCVVCKRGKRGPTGPIGPTGPGSSGPTGPMGPIGPTGPAGISSGDDKLAQLQDVTVIARSGPNDGDILQYNASIAKWTNVPGAWGIVKAEAIVAPYADSPTFTALAVLGSNIGRYLFDNSADEELHFEIHIPGDYAEGTDIIPFIHFIPVDPIGTPTGEYVEWFWEFIWSNVDDTYPFTNDTLSVDQLVLPTNQSQNVRSIFPSISGIDPISSSNYLAYSTLVGRIIRNVSPSVSPPYAGGAALLSFGIYYQKQGTGTTSMLSK